jgi:hypothetical protein
MTQRGIPYSLSEAEIVIASHTMDEYHRELMAWLISLVRPVSVNVKPKEGQRVLLSTNGEEYVPCVFEDGGFMDQWQLELCTNESSVWVPSPPIPEFFNSTTDDPPGGPPE